MRRIADAIGSAVRQRSAARLSTAPIAGRHVGALALVAERQPRAARLSTGAGPIGTSAVARQRLPCCLLARGSPMIDAASVSRGDGRFQRSCGPLPRNNPLHLRSGILCQIAKRARARDQPRLLADEPENRSRPAFCRVPLARLRLASGSRSPDCASRAIPHEVPPCRMMALFQPLRCSGVTLCQMQHYGCLTLPGPAAPPRCRTVLIRELVLRNRGVYG